MSLMEEYGPWAQVWKRSWVVSFLGEPAWGGPCVCRLAGDGAVLPGGREKDGMTSEDPSSPGSSS